MLPLEDVPPSALVLIDLQRDLCEAPRRVAKVNQALPSILTLIDLIHASGGLVVYSYFALAPDDPQFERFGDRYCIEGTPGADLIDVLLPLRGPTLRKTKHSVFFETDLDEMLRARGVKQVFLAGLQTQICVLTSAADASFRGYEPVVVQECVISTSDQPKQDALDWISRYVGTVIELDDVPARLKGAR